MPSDCYDSSSDTYAPKHNPAVYYTQIGSTCTSYDIPMGTTSSGAFATALSENTLPSFAFVTPNLCNDTHDCSITTGDKWLAAWVPKIISSSAYQDGNTALFITWDEGSGGSSGESCAATPAGNAGAGRIRGRKNDRAHHPQRRPSCHVAAIVVTPSTPKGTKSSLFLSHYSLLRATERMLGLRRFLGAAGSKSATGMRAAFHM